MSEQAVQDSSDDIDDSGSQSHSRNSSDSSAGSTSQSSVGEGEDEENVEERNLSLHIQSETEVPEPESVPCRSRRNRCPPAYLRHGTYVTFQQSLSPPFDVLVFDHLLKMFHESCSRILSRLMFTENTVSVAVSTPILRAERLLVLQ